MAGPGRRWNLALLVVLSGCPAQAADPVNPAHDGTYRPSVLVRQGKSVGSGTIIASVEGTTMILTGWHVVDGREAVSIEINRFNLGLEKTRSSAGFPKRLAALVVARDVDADLAILKIKGELAFPYVARLAAGAEPPIEKTGVLTIGFDKGERLVGCSTWIQGVEQIDMGHGGGERSFLVTRDPPEHGRSGGGLFLANGSLVGVCVARAELEKGRKIGLFATLGDVKRLIKTDEEVVAILAKSNRRARSPAR